MATRTTILCLALAMLAVSSAFGQNDRARGRKDSPAALKVGQYAPTFVLRSVDGKEEFDLRAFRDKKPVVLLFGSYT